MKAVSDWLRSERYNVTEFRTTKQRGIDIQADKDGLTWKIEAKGGTSSFEKSSRFGQPFTPNQFIDRAMKGVFTAMALADARRSTADRVSLALPQNEVCEREIAKVRRSLSKLEISLLWVKSDRSVIHDPLI